MTVAATPFLARAERFRSVGSTNDVVRAWLREGTPEVCLAVADEQTAGRGREGRTWVAPPGAALLQSIGFRPTWLLPERTWRLAATVALAMADAAEEAAGLPDLAIRLKWPNDLVIVTAGEDALLVGELDPVKAAATLQGPLAWRKLGGVLGESEGLGTDDPRVVVGIGINAGWRAREFPPELAATMTSLHEASGGRPIDLALLHDGFTGRLEGRIEALRAGFFDLATWLARQVTTGHDVSLHTERGVRIVRALGLDAATGALVVADPAAPSGERLVHAGDIVHLRLAPAAADPAAGV
jgi:BirA family transcriptional regulator, biotin operon repressor / biotin---[acetyl-CoA-carboxylase] ligase